MLSVDRALTVCVLCADVNNNNITSFSFSSKSLFSGSLTTYSRIICGSHISIYRGSAGLRLNRPDINLDINGWSPNLWQLMVIKFDNALREDEHHCSPIAEIVWLEIPGHLEVNV